VGIGSTALAVGQDGVGCSLEMPVVRLVAIGSNPFLGVDAGGLSSTQLIVYSAP